MLMILSGWLFLHDGYVLNDKLRLIYSRFEKEHYQRR